MDKVFKNLLGKNIEVYLNNMVVKPSNPNDHPKYVAEIFAELRKHNMRLNPKMHFWSRGRKILRFHDHLQRH